MSTNKDDNSGKDKAGANISDVILGSLKSRSGKETTRWIANLSESKGKETVETAVPLPKNINEIGKPSQGIVGFMDRLFDLFQQYEFEFNKAVGNSELNIHTERPEIIRDPINKAKWLERSQSTNCLRARVSSRYWTLVILGYNEKIEGYMMPIERYLTFSANPLEFTPYLVVNGTEKGENTEWAINGKMLKEDEVPILGKKLFACLIKFSRGEIFDDNFIWASSEISQNETNNHGAAATVELPIAHLLKQRLQDQSEFILAHHVSTSNNEELTSTCTTTSIKENDFTNDCNLFLVNIEKQLQALAHAGALAFEAQDISETEKTLQRASKIKILRDQIIDLLAEIKSH
jgi:hypothetical protein